MDCLRCPLRLLPGNGASGQAKWRIQSRPRSVMPEGDERSHQVDAPRILVMRGLRSLAYGLLSVLLGVALAGAGFSPAAIGVLLTVSLIGDVVGTYIIGLLADTWGRRHTLALLALLMAGAGAGFGLTTSYPLLLVGAFFCTLRVSASATAPLLPLHQPVMWRI